MVRVKLGPAMGGYISEKNGPQNLSNWLGQEFDIPKIEKLDTYKNLQNMQNHISSNYHPGKTVRHLFFGDYIN